MTVEVIPCAPVANTGELRALSFLRQALEPLPSHHLVLTNYHLPEGNGTLEIDLLVINGRGVFLLEVKDWFGQIEGDSTHWRQLPSNKLHLSPLTSIDSKAKQVHGAIAEVQPELRRVSVVGFVVLTRGDGKLTLADHPDRKRRVFPLNSRLVAALTDGDYLHAEWCIPLDKSRFQQVKDSLLYHKVDPQHHLVGSYQIIGELTPGDTYEAFEAQHAMLPDRRVRLKKYHLPTVRGEKDLDQAVRKFKRDIEALSHVDSHPHITRAYDFFKDPDVDDTYYLALELIEGRTLREIIDEETLSLAQSARLLSPVAEALDFCHQKGIIHRNLSPESIFVTGEGLVKVGDFDFARVPAVSQTISKTGQALVDTKYTAPEQLADARQVDVRADLYSLGVIWYDLLFNRPAHEPVRLTLIRKSELPPEGRDFLLDLLAARPENRPASAAEVRDWFELLAG